MPFQLIQAADIKGNARIEKYFWSSACSTESSRMDRKHGKYVVNIEHSENPAMKENCCNNWSLWKVFLACLLAYVITTAIGILVISLMNNRGNYKSSIVFQLPPQSQGAYGYYSLVHFYYFSTYSDHQVIRTDSYNHLNRIYYLCLVH
ncbi:dynactin-associated protein-like [Mesoplodon densirostris]|uniref:dynactin-associated protein-like n=1 Tax=Mesoplodon densirostris TaxID=48708 RepID=UPI0028DD0B05|nr:dynactin-associated protein-like [Mesoplodon densirostris]